MLRIIKNSSSDTFFKTIEIIQVIKINLNKMQKRTNIVLLYDLVFMAKHHTRKARKD